MLVVFQVLLENNYNLLQDSIKLFKNSEITAIIQKLAITTFTSNVRTTIIQKHAITTYTTNVIRAIIQKPVITKLAITTFTNNVIAKLSFLDIIEGSKLSFNSNGGL